MCKHGGRKELIGEIGLCAPPVMSGWLNKDKDKDNGRRIEEEESHVNTRMLIDPRRCISCAFRQHCK